MFNNKNTIPPTFILDAIPGAPELADAATAAHNAWRDSGQAGRDAGAAAKALSAYHLMDPANRPKEGVAKADFDAAVDSYRVARDTVKAKERARERAYRALHDHVSTGMRSAEFIATHEALGDAAHEKAVAAFEGLRQALHDRDDFDRLIGRQRDLRNVFYDRAYLLASVGDYVNSGVVPSRAADGTAE
ncbi:hypothetical protein [Microbacterium gorillae]|uniref:hypothetical protein n=1 Tax=Microbacterium gorillae TaxID=1231063 RepID=UPI00058E1564|nr:hypothetical protein [Microbacterium gorillae]